MTAETAQMLNPNSASIIINQLVLRKMSDPAHESKLGFSRHQKVTAIVDHSLYYCTPFSTGIIVIFATKMKE